MLEQPGRATSIYNRVTSNGHFVLDVKGQIRHEWEEVSSAAFREAMSGWVDLEILSARIRLDNCTGFQVVRDALMRLGMPLKDAKIAGMAAASNCDYIITDDLDFYEPKKKTQLSGQARLDFMRLGSGSIAKCLRKKFGVNVICSDRFLDDFC